MPNVCAVKYCGKSTAKGDEVRMFTFPKNETLRKKWLEFTQREGAFNVQNGRICSAHFSESDFVEPGPSKVSRRSLKADAFPSIYGTSGTAGKAAGLLELSAFDNADGVTIPLPVHGSMVNPDAKEMMLKSSGSSVAFCKESQTDISAIDVKVFEINTQWSSEREKEFLKLKRENKSLKDENAMMKLELGAVGKIFSKTQISALVNNSTKIRWKPSDIAKGLTIYSRGPRAYKFLRRDLEHPLPAESTLRRWTAKIKTAPGFQDFVFPLMAAQFQSPKERITVLSFDEIKISGDMVYDPSSDRVIGPHQYAQVIMARGLFANWKQPIYYNFDTNMSPEILFSAIDKLETRGFHVASIAHDLSGANRGLWRDLKLSESCTSFKCPEMDQEIFVVPDPPHLIKLLRNHFLDQGFFINGQKLTAEPLHELVQLTEQCELKIAHKLTAHHLTVKGAGRQKVKLAVQVFSNSVASALMFLGEKGLLKSKNWKLVAELIKVINDWFDVMNSRVPFQDTRDRTKAYGLALFKQNEILAKMTAFADAMRLVRKNRKGVECLAGTKAPFQIGILMATKSLQSLFDNVRAKYGIKYILTNRLSQDVLEHFFALIRMVGGLSDHPHCLDFMRRFKRLICGSKNSIISPEANIQAPDAPSECAASFENLSFRLISSIAEEDTISDDLKIEEIGKDVIEEAGLEYIAGYVASKRKKNQEHLGTPSARVDDSQASNSSSWVRTVSEGGLYVPSDEFMEEAKLLRKKFEAFNDTEDMINKKPEYMKNLLESARNTEGLTSSSKTQKLTFRTLTYIRIKEINNRKRKFEEDKRNARKMKKIRK